MSRLGECICQSGQWDSGIRAATFSLRGWLGPPVTVFSTDQNIHHRRIANPWRRVLDACTGHGVLAERSLHDRH